MTVIEAPIAEALAHGGGTAVAEIMVPISQAVEVSTAMNVSPILASRGTRTGPAPEIAWEKYRVEGSRAYIALRWERGDNLTEGFVGIPDEDI
jgi:hypothetical protein